MSRIDLVYGGVHYSVVGRDLAELKSEVAATAAVGGWLQVQDGIGPAHLYLGPGAEVALIELPAADDADSGAGPLP